MNTTQNTRRIIATALLAVTAGLALSSCAGQRQPSEPVTDVQVEYRDLAERRAEMNRELGGLRSDDIGETRRPYLDQRRGEVYLDQAERRAGIGGPVVGGSYRDLSRGHHVAGH
jgi:hypothetical protein